MTKEVEINHLHAAKSNDHFSVLNSLYLTATFSIIDHCCFLEEVFFSSWLLFKTTFMLSVSLH